MTIVGYLSSKLSFRSRFCTRVPIFHAPVGSSAFRSAGLARIWNFFLIFVVAAAVAAYCCCRSVRFPKRSACASFLLVGFFFEETGTARAQKVSPVSSVDLQKCNSISAWPSPFSGFRVAFFLVAIAAAAGCFPTFWPPFCLQQTDRLSHGRKTVACLPWAGLQTSTGSSAQGAELTSIPNIKALSIEYPPSRGRSPWSLCCPCHCQRTVRLSSFAVCGNYRFRFFAKKKGAHLHDRIAGRILGKSILLSQFLSILGRPPAALGRCPRKAIILPKPIHPSKRYIECPNAPVKDLEMVKP